MRSLYPANDEELFKVPFLNPDCIRHIRRLLAEVLSGANGYGTLGDVANHLSYDATAAFGQLNQMLTAESETAAMIEKALQMPEGTPARSWGEAMLSTWLTDDGGGGSDG